MLLLQLPLAPSGDSTSKDIHGVALATLLGSRGLGDPLIATRVLF